VTPVEAMSQRAGRLVRRLRTRRGREKEALVLVEGVRAVATALDAGARVRFAVTAPRLEETPGGSALAARLATGPRDVRRVSDRELGDLSDTEAPQGVLLVCEEPRVSLDDLRRGRHLVLDAVQDPGNAGTLVRAAAAFGLDGVVALDGTVDLWGAKAVRASAGLVFRVPVVRCGAVEALERLRTLEVGIWVADADGEDVSGLGHPSAFALVVGNEGAGIRPEIAASAERAVAVPMRGPAESLNVGIAGSILLYALSQALSEGVRGG
jgi:RNA methyltransferase, TrmH family